MQTRRLMINLHLVLASILMPFMLTMPLSGGLDLLDVDMPQTKEEVFKIAGPIPENAEDFFRAEFKKQNIDFDFEYIRRTDKEFIFRPTSRLHFVATKTPEGVTVSKVNPGWMKRLMEIHKGHGPRLIRWLEILFALTLIMVTCSGIYLAWTVPTYRRLMSVSFLVGFAVIVIALI